MKHTIIITALFLCAVAARADEPRCFSGTSGDTTYAVKITVNGSRVDATCTTQQGDNVKSSTANGSLQGNTVTFTRVEIISRRPQVTGSYSWTLAVSSLTLENGTVLQEVECE